MGRVTGRWGRGTRSCLGRMKWGAGNTGREGKKKGYICLRSSRVFYTSDVNCVKAYSC